MNVDVVAWFISCRLAWFISCRLAKHIEDSMTPFGWQMSALQGKPAVHQFGRYTWEAAKFATLVVGYDTISRKISSKLESGRVSFRSVFPNT